MRHVLCSASMLSISIAAGLLPAVVGQAQAQAPSQAGNAATSLPPVHVEAPQQRATARPATRSNSKRGRVSRANTSPRQPSTAEASPQSQGQQQAPATPLNTNVVTIGASRLGLTPREIPATVEVVGAEMIQERGYHTTIETVKGVTGATAADAPNSVSYAMRGFQGNQINVTYNGINIGPTGFTALTMETFNLDRVEFLKGPSSLMSGLGAVGGTRQLRHQGAPHRSNQERGIRWFRFVRQRPKRVWFRGQHQHSGPRLSVRHQPVRAERLHRRYECQEFARLRATGLSPDGCVQGVRRDRVQGLQCAGL